MNSSTRFFPLLLMLTSALLLTACGGGSGGDDHGFHVLEPDLVPALAPGSATFYYSQSGGQISVYVRNQGDHVAGSSRVRITFHTMAGDQIVEIATPTGDLDPGATSGPLTVDLPAITTTGFTMHVDGRDEVAEGDEGNNELWQELLI